MATYYVDTKGNLKGSQPSTGYQFKGTKEECQQYIANSKKTFTLEEQRQNEVNFLKEIGGDRMVENYLGEEWNKKRKKHDENWDRIRRSRNKRKKI